MNSTSIQPGDNSSSPLPNEYIAAIYIESNYVASSGGLVIHYQQDTISKELKNRACFSGPMFQISTVPLIKLMKNKTHFSATLILLLMQQGNPPRVQDDLKSCISTR